MTQKLKVEEEELNFKEKVRGYYKKEEKYRIG